MGQDVGDDDDGVACGRAPSCHNACSSLDSEQCLRSHVASIERIE